MRVVRTCLCSGCALVLARAAGYLVNVCEHLTTPREVGELESKLVHLAWRVQAGSRALYPAWSDYPHVTNFFSPGYFLVVGLIGSLTGAGLQELFVIGRAVTVACGLTTAIVSDAWCGEAMAMLREPSRRRPVWGRLRCSVPA